MRFISLTALGKRRRVKCFSKVKYQYILTLLLILCPSCIVSRWIEWIIDEWSKVMFRTLTLQIKVYKIFLLVRSDVLFSSYFQIHHDLCGLLSSWLQLEKQAVQPQAELSLWIRLSSEYLNIWISRWLKTIAMLEHASGQWSQAWRGVMQTRSCNCREN